MREGAPSRGGCRGWDGVPRPTAARQGPGLRSRRSADGAAGGTRWPRARPSRKSQGSPAGPKRELPAMRPPPRVPSGHTGERPSRPSEQRAGREAGGGARGAGAGLSTRRGGAGGSRGQREAASTSGPVFAPLSRQNVTGTSRLGHTVSASEHKKSGGLLQTERVGGHGQEQDDTAERNVEAAPQPPEVQVSGVSDALASPPLLQPGPAPKSPGTWPWVQQEALQGGLHRSWL